MRQKARPLGKEEILSPEIQRLIQDMKVAMKENSGVGLSAPQIGKSLQVIVIEDMDHSHPTPQQVEERDRFKVPLQVLINPKLTIEEAETTQFFEGCLSVPHYAAIVPRAKRVRVEYLDERGEPKTIQAKGWHARILQHEIDHVNGILYIDRAEIKTLTTEENYAKLWKNKSIQETKEQLVDRE